MARKIRIEYAGAAYHVMARGNQGRAIYADERDRKLWLATLGEACEKTGWRLHACVMMNNHYHLLLETPEANLVAGMKWLQGTYTQRYNSRHEIFGHVGGTEFKERMLAMVEQPLRQGRSGSYSGEAKRAHGEAEAERLLARGLAALGLAEGQLAEARKGAWEKDVLAWWLCQHTTARRRWVSERLGMGDESRVT